MKRSMCTTVLIASWFAVITASAHAATLDESVTFSGAMMISNGPGTSNAFAQFNPALGTLTNVTLDVAGTGNTNQPPGVPPFNIGFYPNGDTANYLVSFSESIGPWVFNTSGSDDAANALAIFTGTGNTSIQIIDSDAGTGNDMTSIDVTSAEITYTYTASSSPSATPEPSTLELLGTGVLGLAGVVRRRLSPV